MTGAKEFSNDSTELDVVEFRLLLRTLRERAALTGTGLAEVLGWNQSKVSKIERGKQMPTEADVVGWLSACQADAETMEIALGAIRKLRTEHKNIRAEFRKRGTVSFQQQYDELTRQSRDIRAVEVTLIPGFVQTSAYARHVMQWAIVKNEPETVDITAAVAARMKRQDALYDPARRFQFVITEFALRAMPCPRDVMQGQLVRLLDVLELPNVELGILPTHEELKAVPVNSFTLFDEELVVVETIASVLEHRGPEVEVYRLVMDELIAEARAGQQAREMILDSIAALRRPTSEG